MEIVVLRDSAIKAEYPYPTLTLDLTKGKSLSLLTQIWDFLLAHNVTRNAELWCVGGGTLSDLGGLAAATYKRGIPYVNIPTTLLAMVDASIGGKTAIDYGEIKNSIGLFYPPREVRLNTDFLSSLSPHQLLDGYAELLKTALLDSSEFLLQVLAIDPLNTQNSAWKPLIEQAQSVKWRYVNLDPFEQGPRRALNLGHTIGHALELNGLSHGYAVFYGLIAELYLSHVQLGFDKQILPHLTRLMMEYYGRPLCDCKDMDLLMDRMHQDKKNLTPDTISFTLLDKVGHPLINQSLPEPLIREALDYLFTL